MQMVIRFILPYGLGERLAAQIVEWFPYAQFTPKYALDKYPKIRPALRPDQYGRRAGFVSYRYLRSLVPEVAQGLLSSQEVPFMV